MSKYKVAICKIPIKTYNLIAYFIFIGPGKAVLFMQNIYVKNGTIFISFKQKKEIQSPG